MSALSDNLIQKVDSLLNRFAPPERTCSKRTVTRTGNYQLIGRSVAISYSDVVLSPQPFYRRVTHNDAILASNTKVLPDDYLFTLSVNAITKDELTSGNTILVLIDSDDNEEVLNLVAFNDPAINLEVVVFLAIFRSITRP